MRLWSPTFCVFAILVGCSGGGEGANPTRDQSSTPVKGQSTLKKLGTEDVKVGDGPVAAKTGDMIWVWYTGKLANGNIFDTHEKPDAPVGFPLAEGGLIEGWIKGIPGMKAGGVRKLSIPASLAYKEQGQGEKVPPNSDLYFTITLAYVVESGKEKVYDFKDLKPGTGPEAQKGKKVSVLYSAYTLNGDKVIDLTDRSKPDSFTIGKGEVIQGLEYGVIGMKKGGKRSLMLPPDAAFGPNGSPPRIPENTPLRFEVELVDVK